MSDYCAFCIEQCRFRRYIINAMEEIKPIPKKRSLESPRYSLCSGVTVTAKGKLSVTVKRTYTDWIDRTAVPAHLGKRKLTHKVRYKVKNKRFLDHVKQFVLLFGFCDTWGECKKNITAYWVMHLKEERNRIMKEKEEVSKVLWTELLPRLTYKVTELEEKMCAKTQCLQDE